MTLASDADIPFPDGIEDKHARELGGLSRHASPLSLLVLGGLLLAALLGLFGGDRTNTIRRVGDDAILSVSTPRTLRNGMFFETRIGVTARTDIADLVLGIPPSLWRDMTINTMVPAATEESFKHGSFRFSYGALKRGDRIALKFDGQINPPLFAGASGRITLFDGDRPIGALPVDIRVLP